MTLTSSHRTTIAERTDERTNERIKLPQPDLKNITVLSGNVPDAPILPWNHYDSRLDAEVQAPNGHHPESANGYRQHPAASNGASADAEVDPEAMNGTTADSSETAEPETSPLEDAA